ncbi:MAG: hypothetical protein Q4D38_05895 [Planctomycetia bacterium]|nr:hypothetical protein [Planctomycetia bacterium]
MRMKPWETCPQCGTKRIAVCRFCGTKGDDFPVANLDYLIPRAEESNSSQHDSCQHNRDAIQCQEEPVGSDVIAGSTLAESLGPAYATEIRMTAEDEQGHASTGSCSCGTKQTTSLKLVDPLDKDPDISTDEEHPLAVMCPCCDELIYPKYLDTCAYCSYHFPDGIPACTQSHDESEGSTATFRMIVLAVAILGILGAMLLVMAL